MKQLFIFAEKVQQGRDAVRRVFNVDPMSARITYLHNEEQLRGVHGPIICRVGRWYLNKRCSEIMQIATLQDALILTVEP